MSDTEAEILNALAQVLENQRTIMDVIYEISPDNRRVIQDMDERRRISAGTVKRIADLLA